ncbi:MAG TPA: glycosyltransferase family 2 protein [Acidimicrobiales bacterium]|nr:glycosyltransferase family 2 protein [Acidimicrobiales bacterium]
MSREASEEPPALGTGLVSIVTYNSSATIDACLDALETAVGGSALDWKVVVVDNCSSDDTAEILRRRQRRRQRAFVLEVILNEDNAGFAAAVGQATAAAPERDLLVLVNPDCYLSDDTLAVCEQWLARHPGDAAVVQLWNVDGTLQTSAGSAWRPSRQVWRALRQGGPASGVYINRRETRLSDEPIVVDWANMAFFAIGLDVYEELGGLDTRFWMYCEDLDFCLRMKDAGRRVWWLPQGSATHVGGHSSAGVEWSVQDALIAAHGEVFRKRGDRVELAWLRLAMPVLYAARAGRCLLDGRRLDARRHLWAAWTALRLPRPSPPST